MDLHTKAVGAGCAEQERHVSMISRLLDLALVQAAYIACQLMQTL